MFPRSYVLVSLSKSGNGVSFKFDRYFCCSGRYLAWRNLRRFFRTRAYICRSSYYCERSILWNWMPIIIQMVVAFFSLVSLNGPWPITVMLWLLSAMELISFSTVLSFSLRLWNSLLSAPFLNVVLCYTIYILSYLFCGWCTAKWKNNTKEIFRGNARISVTHDSTVNVFSVLITVR